MFNTGTTLDYIATLIFQSTCQAMSCRLLKRLSISTVMQCPVTPMAQANMTSKHRIAFARSFMVSLDKHLALYGWLSTYTYTSIDWRDVIHHKSPKSLTRRFRYGETGAICYKFHFFVNWLFIST